jgi:hypothetical protein
MNPEKAEGDQNESACSITLLTFQGVPLLYTPSKIDHSVRDAPDLYRRWGTPLPPESLESSTSHEIPRKIRRAKKLDTKIRETKDLEADGLISNQTVACAMIARMKSSVKVARHMMGDGLWKKSAGEDI